MALNVPIQNFQVAPNNGPQVPDFTGDFFKSAMQGYQFGRILAGIPQQQDALQLQLTQENLRDAPVDRSLKIGQFLNDPGVITGQESEIPQDALNIGLPGFPGVAVSPSKAQQDQLSLKVRGTHAAGDRPIGVPFVGPDGNNYQTVQRLDGTIEAVRLAGDPGRMPHMVTAYDSQGRAYLVDKSPGGEAQPINTQGGEPLEKKRVLPAAEVMNVEGIKELRNLGESAKTLFKPEFVGMFDSPTGAVQQRTGIGATPEQAEFRRVVDTLKNRMLYLYSGKQINETEYKRLAATLPDPAMSEIDFNSKLSGFMTELDYIEKERKKAFSESGYFVPKETVVTEEVITAPATPSTPAQPSSGRFTIRKK